MINFKPVSRAVIASLVSCAVFGHGYIASAQVSDALLNHFESKGALVSVQGPATYSTATRNIVGLGSFQVRTPQSSTQLISVKAPKMSAGCGGIDIFAGGFSFINGDQIEDLFRNVIQNAKAFAFSLALKIFSSLVKSITEEFMTILQKVNAVNIDSCQAASAAVNVAVDNISKGIYGDCSTLSVNLGLADDAVQSNEQCLNEDRIEDMFGTDAFNGMIFGDLESGETQEDAQQEAILQSPVKNYAWLATANVTAFGDSQVMREFLMSLTGTFIVRTDDGRVVTQAIKGEPIDAVMTVLVDGGTLDVYKCDEPLLCLRPTKSGEVTIDPDDAFTSIVSNLMGSIYDKTSGTNVSGATLELNDDETRFMDTTPFPVQQAALQFVQADQAVGKQHLVKYAPFIATEQIVAFLRGMNVDVAAAAKSVTQAESSTFRDWQNQMRDNIDTLEAKQVEASNRIVAYNAILDEIKDARSVNASTLVRYSQRSYK